MFGRPIFVDVAATWIHVAHAMKHHTYKQLANDYRLWMEYIDPQGLDTREAFDGMTEAERIAVIVRCCGPEPRLTGHDAIDGARTDISISDARDIAREDPSLIYAEAR